MIKFYIPTWKSGVKISVLFLIFLLNTALVFGIKSTNTGGIAKKETSHQEKEIQGVVRNEKGEPIQGVLVLVNGSSKGQYSDKDGKFSLTVPDQTKAISFLISGMLKQEVNIAGQTDLDVTLKNEIRETGYGIQKTSDLSGSISSVKGEDFKYEPVSSILGNIQGKMAGVQVISNSGDPGADKQVFIRGIQSQGYPLFVVDEVITDDFNNINPDDIESISVLKDAAACSIYGSRAANGVIIVTTKRGEYQKKASLTVHAYTGIQTKTELFPKALNSTQWLQLDKESYANAGPAALAQSPYGTQYPLDINNLYKDPRTGNLVNTDWLKEISQPGKVTNYDLSLDWGTKSSKFYTSASYYKQDGLITGSSSDKMNFRFNSDHRIGNFLEIGNTFNFYQNSLQGGSGNPYYRALLQSPLTRPYEIDANGNVSGYGYVRSYTLEGGEVPPQILAKEYKDNRSWNGLAGNVYLKFNILKGLSFVPRISLNYFSLKENQFTPAIHLQGIEGQSTSSTANRRDTTLNWTSDFKLNFERTFNGIHKISASAIYSKENNDYTSQQTIKYSESNYTGYRNEKEFSLESLTGRINYDLKEKYYLQGSVRQDGYGKKAVPSQNGGSNDKFLFTSASGGWRVSKEKFFEPFLNTFNDLKIRASTGNLSVGGNKYYSQNAIGLDLSAFHSKIGFTADYYLSAMSLVNTNTNPELKNLEVQNRGFEFILSYNDQKGNFRYGGNLNFTANQNKVTSGSENIPAFEEGKPYNSYYGYVSNGIVKNQQILQSHPYLTNYQNVFPIGLGDIWTLDTNNDGKITEADRQVIGNKYPDFTYGLTIFGAYKRWTLQITGFGVHGFDLNTISDVNGYFHYGRNETTRVLDRWEANLNPNGNMPKVTKADMARNSTGTSSFWYSDASFFKINNLNLRYSLPDYFSRLLMMKDFEIYGSVQNLYTFTKYPAGEVDVTDQGMWQSPMTKIPQPRIWVIGVVAKF